MDVDRLHATNGKAGISNRPVPQLSSRLRRRSHGLPRLLGAKPQRRPQDSQFGGHLRGPVPMRDRGP